MLEKFKFVCCDKSYPLFFVIFLSFRILDSSPIIMSKLNFFLLTLFGLTWSSPIQPPSGITELGDNCCSKFTRFHESLLKAGASNDQPCIDAQPVCKYIYKPMYLCNAYLIFFISLDECTIPTVEVLKTCVRGLNVVPDCVEQVSKV